MVAWTHGAPELVFDQSRRPRSPRTGAAVLDETIVGNMEFAVASPYETPLIVILGHTGCGAVTATVDACGPPPPIPSAPAEVLHIVVTKSSPSPVGFRPAGQGDVRRRRGARQRKSIAVADALVPRSKIIRHAADAGRTQVSGLRPYDRSGELAGRHGRDALVSRHRPDTGCLRQKNSVPGRINMSWTCSWVRVIKC